MDNVKQITPSTVARSKFNLLRESLGNPSLLSFMGEIRSTLKSCNTVLDIGCGNASPMRFLRNTHTVGVDGYCPALEEARSHGTHDEYFLGDVTGISELFPTRKFDACIALDVIEHLHKEDGWRM